MPDCCQIRLHVSNLKVIAMKKRDKISEADNDVKWAISCIGLNFISLALLKIIGYNGIYLNHINWGEEQVPWAASAP
jgi:hypothetical protein